MCVDQGFLRSSDAALILVVELKPKDLLKICIRTYFVYLMFIFLHQASEWGM
jgi:hypothetical protein